MKEEVRRLKPGERLELQRLLLQIELENDEEWKAEMSRRAAEAREGKGLVSQEEVMALHRRLLAEGR